MFSPHRTRATDRAAPRHVRPRGTGSTSLITVPKSFASDVTRIPRNWGQVTLWAARLAWLAVALIGGRAIGDAVAERSDVVQRIATVGAWTAWAAGALALAVTGLATLTAARAILPGAVVVTGLTAVAGAPASSVLALAGPAAAAAVLVASAETGAVYVQASAYGDERRFVLRPPLGYLIATVVSWSIWVAAVLAAPLALAARSWILGGVAAAIAVAATLVLPRRWHQLTRRWFVAVPAGLVVHDPVVLADTVMLLRAQVAELGAVSGGRDDSLFDLTGPTPGIGVGVVLTEPVTIVQAPRPATPRGKAFHVSAFVVAPSRPGAALREAARRNLPVSG